MALMMVQASPSKSAEHVFSMYFKVLALCHRNKFTLETPCSASKRVLPDPIEYLALLARSSGSHGEL